MKSNTLKVGDLVYTKDVGYPFNRTDDGNESWEGVSCIVIATNVGWNEEYISVEALFPIRQSNGDYMKTCVFFPEQVIKEDRIWLKNNLKKIMSFKKKLVETIDFCNETLDTYK